MIPQEQLRPQIPRARVALEELGARRPPAQPAQLPAGGLVAHLLVRHGAEVLAHPEAAGVAGGLAGGQDVVGADALVAVGDAGVFAEED